MTSADIANLVKKEFESFVVEVKVDTIQPWVEVNVRGVEPICVFLRDHAQTRFDFLRSIAGVDYASELELIYFLFSYVHGHELKLKTRVPRDTPDVASVAGIWPAANWHEREAHELFGFTFQGHPDLRHLLLPEDWVGHPLRKDYKEPANYRGISTSRTYPTAPESSRRG